MVGKFENHEILVMLFWDGWHIYFMYMFIYCAQLTLSVCVWG